VPKFTKYAKIKRRQTNYLEKIVCRITTSSRQVQTTIVHLV
jgi:hypothetical protein